MYSAENIPAYAKKIHEHEPTIYSIAQSKQPIQD